MSSKQPLSLEDCEIKPARRGSKMEIMLKGTTKLNKSPKKIKISTLEYDIDSPTTITLDQLKSTNAYEKVIVNIKVLRCKEPVQVGAGKTKQDVIIGDQSGTAKVTLWEEHVGDLKEHSSYSLYNF